MATLPVRKNHDARTRAADYARNFQAIGPGILDTAVRDIERLPPGNTEKPAGIIGFAFPISGRPASTHFSASHVENPGTLPLLRHLQQGATAGLFHIVTMSCDSKNVEMDRFVGVRS